jgi:hypothetical protein
LLIRTHLFVLVCTFLVGCAHHPGAGTSTLPRSGVAAVVLDAAPEQELYALEVAHALRRSPSPGGAPWLATPTRTAVALADELARIESLFFDLDLEGAERAARDALLSIDRGDVPVEDQATLLQLLIRAAQVFDARGADDAANNALARASAVRPEFELSASDFPPSLIARRAQLNVASERHALVLAGVPGNAHVYVDGAPTRGHRLELAAGRHVLRVSIPGHQPYQQAHDLRQDMVLEPSLEVDPERLHALRDAERQRFLTLHDAYVVRLQVSVSSEGRRCRLSMDGEPDVTVSAPLEEEPAAVAARLMTERDAAQAAQAESHTRRRRRRWVATTAAVAAAGAGAGAYLGLRPGADGWRGNGQLEGTTP